MLSEMMVVWLLAFTAVPTPAAAQTRIGSGLPNVSIGINLGAYPVMIRVPGYPVYYASQLRSNYFFYDGMYWVYQGDNWYASSWYNGPWYLVAPEDVPLYVLRIPVRYYRQPPPYFLGWLSSAPPRWNDHWGNAWAQRRSGWDRWDRGAAPAPAPLPAYQRQYSGDHYPRAGQQQTLQSKNYRYQPRDPAVRQQHELQRGQSVPPQRGNAAQPARQNAPAAPDRASPDARALPQTPQRNRDNAERPLPPQVQPQNSPRQRPPQQDGAAQRQPQESNAATAPANAKATPPQGASRQERPEQSRQPVVRQPPEAKAKPANDRQNPRPVKTAPARDESPPAAVQSKQPDKQAEPRAQPSQEAAPPAKEAPQRGEPGRGQDPGGGQPRDR
jgi:hypothetical protein